MCPRSRCAGNLRVQTVRQWDGMTVRTRVCDRCCYRGRTTETIPALRPPARARRSSARP